MYATSGYQQSITNLSRITLATDNVFSDGSALELATAMGSLATGFTATSTVDGVMAVIPSEARGSRPAREIPRFARDGIIEGFTLGSNAMVPGLLIAVSLSWGGARETNDRWFAIDKTKHFFTAAMVQSVSFTALRTAGVSKNQSLVGATVVAGAASIGKESWTCGGRGRPVRRISSGTRRVWQPRRRAASYER